MQNKTLGQTLSFWLNAWLPPLLWAGIIFLLSAQPSLPGFDVAFFDFIFKKCSHMFVYAVLYLLIFRGLERSRKPKENVALPTWLFAFLICLFYASLDEFHQYFTPTRTPTIRDIGYDMLGVTIAFLWKYRYI